MKYILSESQFKKVLNEQNQKEEIFSDRKEYEKALKIYNDSKKQSDFSVQVMDFFRNLKVPNILCGKAQRYVQSEFYKKFKTPFLDNFSRGNKNLKSLYIWEVYYAQERNNPTAKFMVNSFFKKKSYYDDKHWEWSEKNKERLSYCGAEQGEIVVPIMSKPIFRPETKQENKPELTKTQEIPRQKKFEEPLEGQSVYGPGNSLIGTITGRNFNPITLSKGQNKQDLELLQDKNKLNQFLKLKYGSFIIPLN